MTEDCGPRTEDSNGKSHDVNQASVMEADAPRVLGPQSSVLSRGFPRVV
jgi:hypothetical protein